MDIIILVAVVIKVDMFIQFETGVPYIPPTDEAKKYVAPWAVKAKSSKK